MPAKSKQQQKFFGVVRAMQKGDIPKKGEAGEVADDMKKMDVKKMASTKHKDLPKKVKEIIRQELVKELKLHEVKPFVDPKLKTKPTDPVQYIATNDHRYPSEIAFFDTKKNEIVFFNIQRKEVERISVDRLSSTHWVRDYMPGLKYNQGLRTGAMEGKLNEEDYKYKKYVSKAFADINDAMFNFRNAMGVKQLGQADSKVKDQLESLHQAIFDLQREFKGKGLTEYGGSDFSKITSLQNFLTIDLDKFEKGLKDSKHKAIYKKARKEFMKVVTDVAWEHSKLYEGKLNELKTGNKINKARAKAHFKQGENIAVIDKNTGDAIRITDLRQLDAFDSKTHDFAYITEGNVNEGKYDHMIGKAFKLPGRGNTSYKITKIEDNRFVHVLDDRQNSSMFDIRKIVKDNPGIDKKPKVKRTAWNKGTGDKNLISKREYAKILMGAMKDATSMGDREATHDMAQSMIYDKGILARLVKDHPGKNSKQLMQQLQWDLEAAE